MPDVLSDILDTVALKGTLYFRTDFSPPFAIGVPSYGRAARFHLVVRGACHVSIPGQDDVLLREGELILVPHGSPHVLADAPGRTAAPLEQILAESGYTGEGTLVAGGGGADASTQLICGHFDFADGADHPLLRALPPVLHITRADRARRRVLDDIIHLMTGRVFAEETGTAASFSRLSEVLYIETLLASLDRVPDLKRLMSAAYDPQIGQALTLIHRRYAREWTVDGLATEVGLSRSRFAEAFRDLIGVAPMAYLADWRLQRALALLRQPRASVKEVAAKTGYKSAAVFSRAFRQKFGWAPGARKSGLT